MDIIKQVTDHFKTLGYKIEITKEDAAGINENFTHNIIFLEGDSSIRLFRLIKKFFGDQIRVIGTNKTRVIIFRFTPQGHEEVTGICKVCGCNDETLCPGKTCYWTEEDLSNGCNEVFEKQVSQVKKSHSHKMQEVL